MARRPFGLRTNQDGGAAVEFALVGPLLAVLLMGMAVYGGWFWLAHGVQALAAEAARAAVAGLDADERQALAQAVVEDQARTGLDVSRATVRVTSDARAIRVEIAYDAADHPLMALTGLVPSPPRVIERAAVVRVGGY